MLTMSTGKRIDRRTAEHSTERAKGEGREELHIWVDKTNRLRH